MKQILNKPKRRLWLALLLTLIVACAVAACSPESFSSKPISTESSISSDAESSESVDDSSSKDDSSTLDSSTSSSTEDSSGGETPAVYKIYYEFAMTGVSVPNGLLYDENEKLYYQQVTYMQAYDLPNLGKAGSYKFSHWVISNTQTKFTSGNAYTWEENVILTAVWVDRTMDDNWT